MSSPPPAPTSGWRSSPLGHKYKKFESEWNADGSNKARAAQYGAGEDGAQSRVIYFIERTRQLEVELVENQKKMSQKIKKERRHQSDIADLRRLVNDLCSKIRTVERTRDVATKEKNDAEIVATQLGARLRTVQLDAKKYKSADTRMHDLLIKTNREKEEQKLRAENLEDELEIEKKKAQEAVADASARVENIEKQTKDRLAAANQRAEEVLEELRGIQGGWQEMKNRADASQAREDAAHANAEARILMAENGAKSAKTISKVATEKKLIAEKEKEILKGKVIELDHEIRNRTSEVEELRRENERLKASFDTQQNEMDELQAQLYEKKRLLRDESRQNRVQHIKFIDRRMAEKKLKAELLTNPPKKKPSLKKIAAHKRAEQRAKERAEHKKKVAARRKAH